jgi:signal transduction histidine kinase
MKRPRLAWPRRWRRSVSTDAAVSSPTRGGHEEDLRLLRRTRLRLMGVSGLVTLLILVVLEASVFLMVSAAVESDGQAHLKQVAGMPDTGSDDPYGFTVVGPRAGLIMIPVDPQGSVLVPGGLSALPPGLPDKASLAAVTVPGQVDIRDITTPDGTQYRVMSGYSAARRYIGDKVQLVQNRTSEINQLNTLGSVLLVGGLLALFAALLAGYLYAGRALVPIRASIDRRQAALQRQREFAANASHELRTPLTVIGTSVEDLKRNRRARVEDVGEALGDIEAEVRHMTALVEDMLLLARTDSGVVQIERVPLDLGDIAADAASMLVTLGEERGVKVVLDPLPAPVTGDPLRLRQLVTILVDNAIRHSPAGSTVEARVRPSTGGAMLQVDDQGRGIKPEDLPRIFERFWRADDAPPGGTGLGLAIAKWIVEQHGGAIGAVNLPGGGASFSVWLPNVPVPEAAPDATPKWIPPVTDGPAGPAARVADPTDDSPAG